MSDELKCPVCDLAIDFEPWNGLSPSDEICPRCGIQFGYHDAAVGDDQGRAAIYAAWRQRWITAGRPEQFSVVEPDRNSGNTTDELLERVKQLFGGELPPSLPPPDRTRGFRIVIVVAVVISIAAAFWVLTYGPPPLSVAGYGFGSGNYFQ